MLLLAFPIAVTTEKILSVHVNAISPCDFCFSNVHLALGGHFDDVVWCLFYDCMLKAVIVRSDIP